MENLDTSDTAALFDLVNRNRQYLGNWLRWVQQTTEPKHIKTFLRQIELNNKEEQGFQIGFSDHYIYSMIKEDWQQLSYTL